MQDILNLFSMILKSCQGVRIKVLLKQSFKTKPLKFIKFHVNKIIL